jgi:phosphodiesterase/alkaline phosphatase D-like protein
VAFHFEYGTDTTYGLTTAEQPLPADTAEAPVSVTLTGLAPSTLYYYRLVVTDGSGASYGTDRTLTTTA